jgi:hypothetical protein
MTTSADATLLIIVHPIEEKHLKHFIKSWLILRYNKLLEQNNSKESITL